jgi:hypothetical protein
MKIDIERGDKIAVYTYMIIGWKYRHTEPARFLELFSVSEGELLIQYMI